MYESRRDNLPIPALHQCTEEAQSIIRCAVEVATKCEHFAVSPSHLFYAMLAFPDSLAGEYLYESLSEEDLKEFKESLLRELSFDCVDDALAFRPPTLCFDEVLKDVAREALAIATIHHEPLVSSYNLLQGIFRSSQAEATAMCLKMQFNLPTP